MPDQSNPRSKSVGTTGRGDSSPSVASCRQSGQSLVLFALAASVLIAMMGLALDVGYGVFQRRAAQNAADAAALAALSQLYANRPVSTAVAAAVTANGMPAAAVADGQPSTDATRVRCRYLSNDQAELATACDAVPPVGASPVGAAGVRVTVTTARATFFIRVIGVDSLTVSASASAFVQQPAIGGFSAPFAVCGFDSDQMPRADGTSANARRSDTRQDGNVGSDVNILLGDNAHPIINPAAVNRYYVLHYNGNLTQCGAQSNAQGNGWKGAIELLPEITTLPSNIAPTYGTVSGPLRTIVAGQCPSPWNNPSDPAGCILVVPVIGTVPVGAPANTLYGVSWATFRVYGCDGAGPPGDRFPSATCYYGRLISDAIFLTRGNNTWSHGAAGPTVWRLTE